MSKIIRLEEYKQQKFEKEEILSERELYAAYSTDSVKWVKHMREASKWGEFYADYLEPEFVPTKRIWRLPVFPKSKRCITFKIGTRLLYIEPERKAFWVKNPEKLKKDPLRYVQYLRRGVLTYLVNNRPFEYDRLFS